MGGILRGREEGRVREMGERQRESQGGNESESSCHAFFSSVFNKNPSSSEIHCTSNHPSSFPLPSSSFFSSSQLPHHFDFISNCEQWKCKNTDGSYMQSKSESRCEAVLDVIVVLKQRVVLKSVYLKIHLQLFFNSTNTDEKLKNTHRGLLVSLSKKYTIKIKVLQIIAR